MARTELTCAPAQPQLPLYCQVARTNRESADPSHQRIVVPTEFSGLCHHCCAKEISCRREEFPLRSSQHRLDCDQGSVCPLLQYKFDWKFSVFFAQFFTHSYSHPKKIILRWLMSVQCQRCDRDLPLGGRIMSCSYISYKSECTHSFRSGSKGSRIKISFGSRMGSLATDCVLF